MRFLFLLFSLFLVACAPSQKHLDTKETTDLKPTLADYHMKMKWGLWEQASLYIHPSKRQEFLGRQEELGEEYKIVQIDVKSVKLDGIRAEVETEIEWYDEGMVVKKERFIEEWAVLDSQWRRGDAMKKDEWKKLKQKIETTPEVPEKNEGGDLSEPDEE